MCSYALGFQCVYISSWLARNFNWRSHTLFRDSQKYGESDGIYCTIKYMCYTVKLYYQIKLGFQLQLVVLLATWLVITWVAGIITSLVLKIILYATIQILNTIYNDGSVVNETGFVNREKLIFHSLLTFHHSFSGMWITRAKIMFSCTLLYLNFYPRPVLAFGYCRCLRLSVCVSVCVGQPLACPRDNSWPVSARITKFGP